MDVVIDLSPAMFVWVLMLQALTLICLWRLIRLTPFKSGAHWRGLFGALLVNYFRQLMILLDFFVGLGVPARVARVEAMVTPVLIAALMFLSVLWALRYAQGVMAERERRSGIQQIRGTEVVRDRRLRERRHA